MVSDERPRRDIGKVRISIARHLRDIEQLALDLHAQALNTPNAKDWPGGDALAMIAPGIPQQAWLDRYAEVEMQSYEAERPLSGWNDPLVYQGNTEEQPLNVLATWTRMIREDRDQHTDLGPTISRECDYLRKSLDWATRVDEYDEPEWPLCFELADELRVLVRRMEDVLRDGERPDLSKAKCNRCDAKPRLHRVWTDDPKSDGWRCPNCKEPFDEGEAARALGEMLHADGSEKFIWINYARDVAGIDRRTWHSWRERMKMRMACDIKTRKVIVWWPDVRELVSEHRQRKARLALKRRSVAS